jgi:hypothetical protein
MMPPGKRSNRLVFAYPQVGQKKLAKQHITITVYFIQRKGNFDYRQPYIWRNGLHRERPLDFWLTMATIGALFIPIWGILLEPSGLISVPRYLLYVGIPALLLVVAVLIYAGLFNRVLLNRFVIGYIAGFIGSSAVHILLLAGRVLHLAPDLTGILGKMMLGIPLDAPTTTTIVIIGLIYHYMLNGAAWGAAYALAFGKTLWWIGVLFGLGIVAVLLISPAFQRFGFEEVGEGRGAIVLISLVFAHVVYGGLIGFIVKKYVFPEVGIEGVKAIKPTYA